MAPVSPTDQERKGKTATPAQKKNLENARAARSSKASDSKGTRASARINQQKSASEESDPAPDTPSKPVAGAPRESPCANCILKWLSNLTKNKLECVDKGGKSGRCAACNSKQCIPSINPFVTKTMALYDHAMGNTATMTTSEYTDGRNELMDEVREYIAGYNKPSGFKRDRSETAASDPTPKRAKKAAPLTPSQPHSDPFGRKMGPDGKLLSTDLTPSKVSAHQASVQDDKEEDETTVPASDLSGLSPSPPGTERGEQAKPFGRETDVLDKLFDDEGASTSASFDLNAPVAFDDQMGHIDTSLGVNKKSIRPGHAASSQPAQAAPGGSVQHSTDPELSLPLSGSRGPVRPAPLVPEKAPREKRRNKATPTNLHGSNSPFSRKAAGSSGLNSGLRSTKPIVSIPKPSKSPAEQILDAADVQNAPSVGAQHKLPSQFEQEYSFNTPPIVTGNTGQGTIDLTGPDPVMTIGDSEADLESSRLEAQAKELDRRAAETRSSLEKIKKAKADAAARSKKLLIEREARLAKEKADREARLKDVPQPAVIESIETGTAAKPREDRSKRPAFGETGQGPIRPSSQTSQQSRRPSDANPQVSGSVELNRQLTAAAQGQDARNGQPALTPPASEFGGGDRADRSGAATPLTSGEKVAPPGPATPQPDPFSFKLPYTTDPNANLFPIANSVDRPGQSYADRHPLDNEEARHFDQGDVVSFVSFEDKMVRQERRLDRRGVPRDSLAPALDVRERYHTLAQPDRNERRASVLYIMEDSMRLMQMALDLLD
ncbi:hypothetical protein HBI65_248930 [Parastagonospora nodorum]|nr:hypothetical protein HBH67_174430 [Parastagonospora nodorum]KAH4701506.1 hypothetical protein HBH78_058090 [Parastagonospora nodorum]KAH4793725.1 hypothetical protein HBH62_009230 [Parastagonospora nodorum]KAH4838239.1 hypothetical protein HBH63_006870 [Parastagonospora nodorum]KAH6072128.1 hypothetical protein HBI65_248930 [Parastagonospora nodorum]